MTDLKQILIDRFGLTDFRLGQQEVIEAVLQGRDTMIVMPTGSGKSLCFQLPALLLDGITIIVSPLIALMKDQTDALTSKGIPATFLNSSLSQGDYSRRVGEILQGKYKLLYIAPERFGNIEFCGLVQTLNISLLVVDEAHCISQWGHDFRPDYRKLKQARKMMKNPPVLGATATATPEVRVDVIAQLEMKNPLVKITGFDRPNLTLIGAQYCDDNTKVKEFEREIESIFKTGKVSPAIIYCGTRNICEILSTQFNKLAKNKYGIERLSCPYHAEMPKEDKEIVQESFQDNTISWVVATIAFGMGIDKPDIRNIWHYTIPGSVESYYQEVGRAGRDGLPSTCKLFYSQKDIGLRHFFTEISHPQKWVFEATHKMIRRLVPPGEYRDLKYDEVAREISKKSIIQGQVKTCLTLLKHQGVFTAPMRGRIATPITFPRFENLHIDYDDIQARKQREMDRLEDMKGLVEANDKKKYILKYFGEIV
jgi:ATP-dependent DNA helicase RecQ